MKQGERVTFEERLRRAERIIAHDGEVTARSLATYEDSNPGTTASFLSLAEERGKLARVATKAGWPVRGRYTLPDAPNAYKRRPARTPEAP